MDDKKAFWSPVCRLVMRLHCWVRIAWNADGTTQVSRWSQLLTMPEVGSGMGGRAGPDPRGRMGRNFDAANPWRDGGTAIAVSGCAGEEILEGLRGTLATWEL